MRAFFELLNEYPWTSIFLGVFILACLGIVFSSKWIEDDTEDN